MLLLFISHLSEKLESKIKSKSKSKTFHITPATHPGRETPQENSPGRVACQTGKKSKIVLPTPAGIWQTISNAPAKCLHEAHSAQRTAHGVEPGLAVFFFPPARSERAGRFREARIPFLEAHLSVPAHGLLHLEARLPGHQDHLPAPERRLSHREAHLLERQNHLQRSEHRLPRPEARLPERQKHLPLPEARLRSGQTHLLGPEARLPLPEVPADAS